MAKKKTTTKKKSAAESPVKPEKAAASKSKNVADKKTAKEEEPIAAKSKTSVAKKKPAVKAKEITEEKISAVTSEAVTKKSTGTMATKETPDASDNKRAGTDATPDALKVQVVSDEKKKELETRTTKTDELNKLFTEKVTPMFSEMVKHKSKTTSSSKTKTEVSVARTEVAMPSDQPIDEVTSAPAVGSPEVNPQNPESPSDSNDDKGFSIGDFKINFDEFDGDVFKELSKIFREETVILPPKEEVPEPMVILADFTLPYHCCDDYVGKDMCYSDEELVMLPIPPFAKDDFAVTRKNTPVDIYPDLNDSHLFRDFIVVKEIDENQSFFTAANGKVSAVKTGEHAHFVYEPPAGKAGISDSFNYTLINQKNGLLDMATVWIEVAELLPEFSIRTTSLCHNGNPEPINVSPNENEWNEIEVEGNGIIKTTDTNNVPSWTFDPQAANVVIGVNTVYLKLNGKEADRIDVTVSEIRADFLNTGEMTSYDVNTGSGMIVIHDQSLNVQTYNWEWRSDSTPNTATISPGTGGTVSLPLPRAPRYGNFTLNVILNAVSPQGCVDQKSMEVHITGPKRPTPFFPVKTHTMIRNEPVYVIPVDPQEADWKEIDVKGNGITKTTDASGNPIWKFDPKNSKVVTGENTITLFYVTKATDDMKITVSDQQLR